MIMFLSDLFTATALTYLAYILFIFIIAVYNNRGKHGIGSIESNHFFDHVVAGIVGFVGCVLGAICSVIHLVLQNTGDHIIPANVEVIDNISQGVLFLAASMFVHHMICEENPKHPFYYLHFPMGVKK